MKGFAMLGINNTGWIEKDRPVFGPLDALVRPIAVSPCTSDVHTVWEGAIGDRNDMILGHEAVGVVEEVGELVRDFKPGDKVMGFSYYSRLVVSRGSGRLPYAFDWNACRMEVFQF